MMGRGYTPSSTKEWVRSVAPRWGNWGRGGKKGAGKSQKWGESATANLVAPNKGVENTTQRKNDDVGGPLVQTLRRKRFDNFHNGRMRPTTI